MRVRPLIAIAVALALVGCGATAADEDDDERAAETPPPPTYDVAVVIPEAEDGPVSAGTIVELVYPGGESRGVSHFLQRWDGESWTDVYQILASDPGQPFDRGLVENGWALADEQRPTTDLGFEGTEGGQFTIVPPPTRPGIYRICDERRTLCSAAFEVTD